jgi:cytochrome c553
MKAISRWSRVAFVLAVVAVWAPASNAQDANSVRGIAATCANCHGTDGRSAGTVPGLAGVDKGHIVAQMQDFKTGKRPSTIMQQLAKGYTDAQIEQVAAYFAAQRR